MNAAAPNPQQGEPTTLAAMVKRVLTPTTPRDMIVLAINLVAIVLGLVYGYDFGKRASGTVLGVIAAINMAVFCSIMVSAIAARVFPEKAADRPAR